MVGMPLTTVPAVGAAVATSGAPVGDSARSVGAEVSGRISMGGAIGQDIASPSVMQSMPGHFGQFERHWLVSVTQVQVGVSTQETQVVEAVHSWPTAARGTVADTARRRRAEMSFILLFVVLALVESRTGGRR